MKSVEQRRRERQARNQAERNSRKRQRAPETVEVAIGDTLITLPISEDYAPLLKRAGENQLLELATKYKLPITQEERLLIEGGDTFLPQFQKIQLSVEEETQLMTEGWAPLVSSNLKAVRTDGEDLLIKFHSEAVYRYPDQSAMYFPFNQALSPGRLLWRTIRTIRGYRRIE